MNDARVGAWLSAWKILEDWNKAADELRTGKEIPDQTFEREMSKAQILADLANAPEFVGFAAGGVLDNEHRHRAALDEHATEMLKKFEERHVDGGS